MTIYIGATELAAFTDVELQALYRGDVLVYGGAGQATFLSSEDGLDLFVSEDLQDQMIAE